MIITTWRLAAVALALSLVMPTAEAKLVTGELELKEKKEWVYLSKFSYSLGSGNFTVNVQQKVSHALLILDPLRSHACHAL